MLTLSLLRHAKSSWDDDAAIDFDRPLNDRGRAAAARMGALLRAQGLKPDHVLCSPAMRTRQTFDLAAQTWPGLAKREPDFQPDLYHATPVPLLRAIRAAPAKKRHVLLVGHNPGLHEFCRWMIASGPAGPRAELQAKLPTGGLVVLTFEVAKWTQVKPGNGHLLLFARPRDLDDPS